ncbi:MAG: hypothetical protein JXA43_01605 [Candidatus Diapherotrites archaeon]|nr:hypothetical protein [Candidatus Diapherotrites archaeon]
MVEQNLALINGLIIRLSDRKLVKSEEERLFGRLEKISGDNPDLILESLNYMWENWLMHDNAEIFIEKYPEYKELLANNIKLEEN